MGLGKPIRWCNCSARHRLLTSTGLHGIIITGEGEEVKRGRETRMGRMNRRKINNPSFRDAGDLFPFDPLESFFFGTGGVGGAKNKLPRFKGFVASSSGTRGLQDSHSPGEQLMRNPWLEGNLQFRSGRLLRSTESLFTASEGRLLLNHHSSVVSSSPQRRRRGCGERGGSKRRNQKVIINGVESLDLS